MFLTPLLQYTFIREMRVMEVNGKKTWVCLAKSRVFPNLPERDDGVIRVGDFQQACVMQSDGNVGARGIIIIINYRGASLLWTPLTGPRICVLIREVSLFQSSICT